MGGCGCKDEKVTGKILFLGLPDSGKTTLLYHMKLNEVVTSIPTHGYNMEYVDIGKHRYWALYDFKICFSRSISD